MRNHFSGKILTTQAEINLDLCSAQANKRCGEIRHVYGVQTHSF